MVDDGDPARRGERNSGPLHVVGVDHVGKEARACARHLEGKRRVKPRLGARRPGAQPPRAREARRARDRHAAGNLLAAGVRGDQDLVPLRRERFRGLADEHLRSLPRGKRTGGHCEDSHRASRRWARRPRSLDTGHRLDLYPHVQGHAHRLDTGAGKVGWGEVFHVYLVPCEIVSHILEIHRGFDHPIE